jgi:hypothetical protein
MSDSTPMDDTMNQIVALLQDQSPDISNLCDLVYHYNKSLGLTYTKIRAEIGDLHLKARMQALKNFILVIEELKSPTLFIQLDDE